MRAIRYNLKRGWGNNDGYGFVAIRYACNKI